MPGLSMIAGGGLILLGVGLAIGYARRPASPLASNAA
jgi:hypothetical protein